MQKTANELAFFLIVVTILILIMVGFITTVLLLYRKKQVAHFQTLESLKLDHDKSLLKSQVEVQEETFNHIAREIHDNISLSLTLAKLNLLTIKLNSNNTPAIVLINSSIDLISKSISDLSDISKSMNSDVIVQQGLLDVLKRETQKIKNLQLFEIDITVTGSPIFMDSQKELIVFRIIQEALNNIIKHSNAQNVKLTLDYKLEAMEITIVDDGVGFDVNNQFYRSGEGLTNMKTRAQALSGNLKLETTPNRGTKVLITVPFISYDR